MMTPSNSVSAGSSIDPDGWTDLIEESGSGGCCSSASGESNFSLKSTSLLGRESSTELAELTIDFLEVEMPNTGGSGCSACDSVRTQLDAAIAFAEPLFAEIGVQLTVRATQVRTEEEVRRLGVRGSPTIRIGGVSLFPEHRGTTEDRVWTWRGDGYASPPGGLLLHFLLRGYSTWTGAGQAGNSAVQAAIEEVEIPGYLRQFLNPEGLPYPLNAAENHCC